MSSMNQRLSDSHLNSNPQFTSANRSVVRQSMNNSTDLTEAFIKIHEALNNPAYERHMNSRMPMVNNWNKVMQNQLDDDR